MGAKAKIEPPRTGTTKPPPGLRERTPRPRGWGRVVGWRVDEHGEPVEGIAPSHRDALLMVRETDSREGTP